MGNNYQYFRKEGERNLCGVNDFNIVFQPVNSQPSPEFVLNYLIDFAISQELDFEFNSKNELVIEEGKNPSYDGTRSKTFILKTPATNVYYEKTFDGQIIKYEAGAKSFKVFHISKTGNYCTEEVIKIPKEHVYILVEILRTINEIDWTLETYLDNLINVKKAEENLNFLPVGDESQELQVGCQTVKISPDCSIILWKEYTIKLDEEIELSAEDFETVERNLFDKINSTLEAFNKKIELSSDNKIILQEVSKIE